MTFQVLIDATTIFKVSRTDGTLMVLKVIYNDKDLVMEGQDVDSKSNVIPICFYLKGDSYDNLFEYAGECFKQVMEYMQLHADVRIVIAIYCANSIVSYIPHDVVCRCCTSSRME